MRPLEETWVVDDDIPPVQVLSQSGEEICELPTRDTARASMIAAAPDMARVLLDIEWEGINGHCPSCMGSRYIPGGERAPHRHYCALDASLRKAGVR